MARHKIVTPDNVVGVIETADAPFATTKTIAEELDVTAQAVRNNEDELMAADALNHGQVSRSTVYWLAETERPEEVEEPPAEPPEPEREPTHTPTQRDSDGGKGILDRLFAGLPQFGSPRAAWVLLLAATVVGLTGGVTLSILITRPPAAVALLAVSALLGLVLLAFGAIALHEIRHPVEATTGAEKA